MRLVIRDLVVTDKDDILLNNAAYSFLQGKAYRINAPERIKKLFLTAYLMRADMSREELS